MVRNALAPVDLSDRHADAAPHLLALGSLLAADRQQVLIDDRTGRGTPRSPAWPNRETASIS